MSAFTLHFKNAEIHYIFNIVVQIKEKLIRRCNISGGELTHNPCSTVLEDKQYRILKTYKVPFFTEVAAVLEFNSN